MAMVWLSFCNFYHGRLHVYVWQRKPAVSLIDQGVVHNTYGPSYDPSYGLP